MIEDRTTIRKRGSTQDIARSWHSPRTRSFEMTDMTGLIIAAIASSLAVGLLALPVTMPGTAFVTSQPGAVSQDFATAAIAMPSPLSA